jgi:RimJ/RimL family protein N-acetyltransferase
MAISAAVTNSPSVRTARLVLGAFQPSDAEQLQRLAGDREIADTTLLIPHPYELDHALAWIGNQRKESVRGRAINFAVRLAENLQLIGCAGLRDIDREHRQAELGFWIGREYWGRGFASEAAAAVVQYGFDTLGLNRICAHHMARNPAAGKVLQRIGMAREGLLRQRVLKWGLYEDVVIYAILRDDLT